LLSKSKHHGGKIIDLDKSPFGEKSPYDENKENKNLYGGNEIVNEEQPLTSFQLSQIVSNNEAVSEDKTQSFILIKAGSGAPNAPMKQVEPIFHTVPPRPQRLLHSEAYIRYIEGLTTESNTMSNWERQLKASKELVKCPDEARLPAHWLANNGEHGTSLDALWGLRDFLMCDSLGVQRIVQGPL